MGIMITASVVSMGTQIYGAVSANNSAKRSSSEASRQNAIANRNQERLIDLSEAELEDQRGRLADWEETFGGLEDNLADYYNNLDADDIRREGFEKEKGRHQAYVKQLKKQFGATGNTGSNVEQLTLASAQLQSSQNIAKVDQNAEREAIGQQSEFLKIGLDKEAGIRQGIDNSTARLSNAITGQATSALNKATSATNSANAAKGARDSAIGSIIGTGISTFNSFSKAKPPVDPNLVTLPK